MRTKDKLNTSRMFELLNAFYSKAIGFLFPRPETIYFIAKISTERFRWAPYFEAGTKPVLSLKEYIFYAYSIFMAVRYQISSYILTYEDGDPSKSPFFKLDVVMEAVYVKSHFDRHAFFLTSFLLLYAIALHYQRHYITCQAIIETQYRLIVGTLASFWNGTLRGRLRIDFESKNIAGVYAGLVRNSRHIVKASADYKASLGYFKLQPAHQQRKLVALLLKVEQVNLIFYTFNKLLIIATAVSYTAFALRHRKHYHAYQYLFIFFDRIATMSIGTRVIQNQFTGIYVLLVLNRVYGSEYKRVVEDLGLLLKALRIKRTGGTAFRVANTVEPSSIRTRHTLLSKFINTYNHVVASRELYIFVIFNIPFNIYITTRVIFAKTPQPIVLALTIFQVLASLVSAMPMLRINKLIHKPAEYLPALQSETTGIGVSTREKLKLMTFYEQIAILDAKSNIGLTIGPLGILTKYATFKFIIFYIVYAIFSCSIIRKF